MTNTNHTPMTVLPIHKLHDFENHAYKVQDNEEMGQLTESIQRGFFLEGIRRTLICTDCQTV